MKQTKGAKSICGNKTWAEHLARVDGSKVIKKEHALSAAIVAGPEFLPCVWDPETMSCPAWGDEWDLCPLDECLLGNR